MPIHTVDWDSQDWHPVRKGLERKTFAGEGATLALHRVHPGHELSPHAHHYEQIVYMLEGRAIFHVGDEAHPLARGSVIVIPPNVTHYIEVVGNEPALELDVFTPKRPEYGG